MRKKLLLLLLLLFALLIYQLVIVNSQRGVGVIITIRDTTPPLINITKLAPTPVGSVTLTGTFSDETALANITIEFNSSYKRKATINPFLKTWSVSANLSEGWNKFYVLAYDTSRNFANVTSSSQGASVLVDTTKPTISLTNPQNKSSVANNSQLSFKISDLSLANAFYTLNSGATTSFNSVYELKAGASGWVNGINYIIVNATDFATNAERKNFTFIYSNNYEVVLNNSIATAQDVINNTNGSLSNLQNSAALQSLVNNFAAAIPVTEYNKTLQTFNVVANLSNALGSIQLLLQGMKDANSSGQNNGTKTSTINAKLEEISNIKNTTTLSIDVNSYDPNVTVVVEQTTKTNVTNQIFATVAGLSEADRESFRNASEALQNKTTITNKVQTLTQTFLNGRTENITLFEKNVSLSESQTGVFYVNEIIDKNITGENNLDANADITNQVSNTMTVVVADPTVSWSFSDATGAVIGYSVNANVPSDKVSQSQTVLTTVPTAGTGTAGTGTAGTTNAGAGSGGGGIPEGEAGLETPVVMDFSIDKTSIKVTLKQGETKKETLTIKNLGTAIFDVKTAFEGVGNFQLSPETGELTTALSPNEEKTIEFEFKALENEKPGIYPGKITFKSPTTSKEIAIVIEIDSAKPLFDVDVEVLPDSKTIFPGQELSLEVNLFNIRGFGRVDVEVEYSIKDLKGNAAVTEHETLAVETQAKFTRSLLVPSDLAPGSYVAFAQVTYADSIGVSSDLFEVNAKTLKLYAIKLSNYKTLLLIGIIVSIVIASIFSAYKFVYSKRKLPTTKVEEQNQLRTEGKMQKLKKELEALDAAYKSGFISEESHGKGKIRIEEKIKYLKNIK